MNEREVDPKRVARRQYYADNRERERASARRWYAAHREERKAYDQAQYAAHREEARAYAIAHREERSAWHRNRKYQLDDAGFAVLLEKQGGVCAICQWADPGVALHVDHSHDTGRIRGLLCGNCNRALGLLVDDPGLLRLAADYLERLA